MKLNKGVVETDIDYLHQKCEPINIKDKEKCEQVAKVLRDGYDKLNGKLLGLAAIQLRQPVCAVLIKFYKGEPHIYYNPKVIFSIGAIDSNEGCESEKPYRYIVKRPLIALVSYYTENRHKVVRIITHRKARIFCHEYDHTNGVLLQDKGRRVT